MNDYCDLIQTLDHYVSPQRKSHILSVRETAARILWDQGLDDLLEKAQIAALLHDITKEFSLPLQLEIIKKYNLPLTAEAYEHLKPKADGILITKDRYVIPEKGGLFIELDIFHGEYEGVLLAEVEFPTEEAANAYTAPEWFGEDVTYSTKYHNSTMSQGW